MIFYSKNLEINILANLFSTFLLTFLYLKNLINI